MRGFPFRGGVRGLAAAALTVVAAASFPGAAHADQSSFISQLNDRGVYYGGSDHLLDMIDYGQRVCHDLRAGRPVDELLNRIHQDGFTEYESVWIAVAASGEMCTDTWGRLQEFVGPRPRLNRAE